MVMMRRRQKIINVPRAVAPLIVVHYYYLHSFVPVVVIYLSCITTGSK